VASALINSTSAVFTARKLMHVQGEYIWRELVDHHRCHPKAGVRCASA